MQREPADLHQHSVGRQPPAAVAAAISLSACLRMPALPRHPSSLGSPIIADDKRGGGGRGWGGTT